MSAPAVLPATHRAEPTVRMLRLALPGYVAALVASELVLVFVDGTIGLLGHAALILALLGHFVIINWVRRPAADASAAYHAARILPTLALVPLLRLLSLALPAGGVPVIWWYPLVGTPVLLATVLMARRLHFDWAVLGFRRGRWSTQLLIACSGPPAGLVIFLLVRPEPLGPVSAPSAAGIMGASAALLFAGLVEETLFRGLLFRALAAIYPRAGLSWSTALFATSYIASRSLGLLALMALSGLFFGWCVARTDRIWGVAVANGTLAATALVVCPLLFS